MKLKSEYDFYAGASLFNGREVLYNGQFTSCLENNGKTVFLPQRDGFEFTRLAGACAEILPPENIGLVVARLIYYLDLGWAIPHTNGAVIINFDEHSDGGALKESSHAREIGKKVIGFRTDVRGYSLVPEIGGAHYFNTRDCDAFVRLKPQDQPELAAKAVIVAAEKIKPGKRIDVTGRTKELLEIGTELYSGTPDIHGADGLREILRRYQAMTKRLDMAETQYFTADQLSGV